MIRLKTLILESNFSVKLTKEDAIEILHKIQILSEEPDLQLDYGLTQEQVINLLDSIPPNGGIWSLPPEFLPAVKGEMTDHIQVLRDIAKDAYNADEKGQALRIAKQAVRFEKMFGV
jgi:hypothetical protein